jgi:hypothetical protein
MRLEEKGDYREADGSVSNSPFVSLILLRIERQEIQRLFARVDDLCPWGWEFLCPRAALPMAVF